MYYIGSTQNTVKERCAYQHADDVCRLVNRDAQSDSFANHFAKHLTENQGVKRCDICKHMSVDILWEGNLITSMKMYRTNHCVLCMEERCAILEQWKADKKQLINNRLELFGGCRCRTRFHRLSKQTSPDEG